MSRSLAIRIAVGLTFGSVLIGGAVPVLATVPEASAPAPEFKPDRVAVMTPAAWDSLNLARATLLWQQGDLRDAVIRLQAIDVSGASGFARADRAAFLLAMAHLQLGDYASFDAVAATGDADSDSPYRRWLAYARLLVTDATAGARAGAEYWKLPGTVVLTAAHLLESGQADAAATLLETRAAAPEFAAHHRYLQELANDADSRETRRAWRDLDPAATSDRTAPLAATAVHALLALAAGDTASAREVLRDYLPDSADGPRARRTLQIAGQLAAADSAWSTAARQLDAAALSWDREAAWLAGLAETGQADRAWRIWTEQTTRAGEIPWPRLSWPSALRDAAAAATDLRQDPDFRAPEIARSMPSDQPRGDLVHAMTHSPDANEWAAWDQRSADLRQARTEYERRRHALAELGAERKRRRDYLATGQQAAAARLSRLTAALADLDTLLARLDQALGNLDRTRAEALHLFAQRTAAVAEELRTSLLYVQAVRHFHVAGPGPVAEENWPASIPRPAELLDLEEALADEILAFLTLFNERVPDLVNRSCAEIWAPRLAVDGPALHRSLTFEQRRAQDLIAALDSTAHDLPVARHIARAEAAVAQQAAVVDSLQEAANATRAEIIAQVAARGQAQLARDREGLDYQRGHVRYWLAVSETPALDDTAAQERARGARGQAHQSLRAYLDTYPTGRARAEVRYRLADLELLQARDDFQARMAGFLDSQPAAQDLQNRELAPFVDYAPAVALYKEILQDDPDFAHLPAVLFQLGMILGDAGDPQSGRYLAQLVRDYPEAPFNQEAHLRLGDERFAARDFVACRPHFAAAAEGADPALRAIALYKLGWARFEEDQFAAAADAFGRLLDHYAESGSEDTALTDVRAAADLADEAREYLVHALIRAGGATAFSEHFARVGARPYAAEILIAMGHQLSGVSLYGEAIACDRLWLERFGDRDQAVAVSERIVSAYRRWHKPDEARAAHLALAVRFLPAQAWVTAHGDDPVRAEAEAFARDAYRRAAVHHHQQARQNNDPAAWRQALQLYDSFLAYWPTDELAIRMHHQAGEAAYRLGRHEVALEHFRVAAGGRTAATDTSVVAREAAWQVVAVSDAWYRETQGADPSVAGADSLARRLITAVDWYRNRLPDQPTRPDLMWRKGQVAYAHGWYAEAARTLAELGRDHPDDSNAVRAVRMSGDAWYRLADYRAAGSAYEQTLELARRAGSDSVVAAMTPIIPRCHYQYAEQIAAADTVTGPVAAAPLFAQVAERWPDFAHADLALYRTGLGYESDGDATAATTAWGTLLNRYPDSAYARDSSLRIAAAHEAAGQWRQAAAALDRFSARFAADPDAAEALLKAGDLLTAGGDAAGAAAVQTAFLARFPQETETVMAIREERAARELATLTDARALASAPEVQAYLELARAHPQWAAPAILAQVDFLRAEQARERYTALKLTQPLPEAVKAKQQSLEDVLALYARCANHGVAEYTRAAAFQIGAAITHFGDALLASERPSTLQGDDLLAYEEVLEEQSWPFYDRGEAAWTDLLRQAAGQGEDPGQWLARTRQELWPRVAQRFAHMPEAEYPLVAAVPPPQPKTVPEPVGPATSGH